MEELEEILAFVYWKLQEYVKRNHDFSFSVFSTQLRNLLGVKMKKKQENLLEHKNVDCAAKQQVAGTGRQKIFFARMLGKIQTSCFHAVSLSLGNPLPNGLKLLLRAKFPSRVFLTTWAYQARNKVHSFLKSNKQSDMILNSPKRRN